MIRKTVAFLWVGFLVICAGSAPVNTQSLDAQQVFTKKLVSAAIERTQHVVRYAPAYVHIPYPGGDVPSDTGVCTDEIIRAYRAVGVDLQKEVHEDILRDATGYTSGHRAPLKRSDASIDHRRVPNLMVFFSRHGKVLAISKRPEDYVPGEIVTWDLGADVPHIGIVVDRRATGSARYMVVHNIGQGPKMEDVLFDWKITGHYLYLGPEN
jgi:uncharacterized protein YijF (DUF1287 family)